MKKTEVKKYSRVLYLLPLCFLLNFISCWIFSPKQPESPIIDTSKKNDPLNLKQIISNSYSEFRQFTAYEELFYSNSEWSYTYKNIYDNIPFKKKEIVNKLDEIKEQHDSILVLWTPDTKWNQKKFNIKDTITVNSGYKVWLNGDTLNTTVPDYEESSIFKLVYYINGWMIAQWEDGDPEKSVFHP